MVPQATRDPTLDRRVNLFEGLHRVFGVGLGLQGPECSVDHSCDFSTSSVAFCHTSWILRQQSLEVRLTSPLSCIRSLIADVGLRSTYRCAILLPLLKLPGLVPYFAIPEATLGSMPKCPDLPYRASCLSVQRSTHPTSSLCDPLFAPGWCGVGRIVPRSIFFKLPRDSMPERQVDHSWSYL